MKFALVNRGGVDKSKFSPPTCLGCLSFPSSPIFREDPSSSPFDSNPRERKNETSKLLSHFPPASLLPLSIHLSINLRRENMGGGKKALLCRFGKSPSSPVPLPCISLNISSLSNSPSSLCAGIGTGRLRLVDLRIAYVFPLPMLLGNPRVHMFPTDRFDTFDILIFAQERRTIFTTT